jgi:hypothetical protein
LECVGRFPDEGRRITAGSGYTEFPRIDARDIHQIADQAVHAGRMTLNSLGLLEDQFALVGFRSAGRENRGAHQDSAKKIAQVVADDSKEVVSIRECVIGAIALRQQVAVSCVPFLR